MDKSPYYQAGISYEESNDPYPLQNSAKTHGCHIECNDSEPCKYPELQVCAKMDTPSKPSEEDGNIGIQFHQLGLPLGKWIN